MSTWRMRPSGKLWVRLATEAAGWLLFLLALYLLVRCGNARAEEPCRRVDGTVVCSAVGFKALTDTLIDTEVALQQCRGEVGDLRGRITACRKDCAAIVPPVPVAPPVAPSPRSALPAVSGAAMVAIGAAGVVLATTLTQVGGDWRAGIATAGIASLSVGVVLVLP